MCETLANAAAAVVHVAIAEGEGRFPVDDRIEKKSKKKSVCGVDPIDRDLTIRFLIEFFSLELQPTSDSLSRATHPAQVGSSAQKGAAQSDSVIRAPVVDQIYRRAFD